MKPAHKLLLWGAALLVAGLLSTITLRGFGNKVPMPTGSAPVATTPATAVPTAPPASAETLPWMQGGATGTAIARAAAGTAAPPATQADIDKSLVDIRRKSEQNVHMADEMLMQLDALEKSGKAAADVPLDALRNNLIVAKRAQLLAREMAESTQLPDSPQRRLRNAEIIAELRQLQGQLRYDVGAVPAAPGRAQ